MTARPARSISFTSRLGSSIEAYLRMKEALGRRYAAERTILRALDTFLTTIDDDLTSDTFVAWKATLGRLTPGVRRNWLRVVRNLCLYRRRTVPDALSPTQRDSRKPTRPFDRTSLRRQTSLGCSTPPITSLPPRVHRCAGRPSDWPSCCSTRAACVAASSSA